MGKYSLTAGIPRCQQVRNAGVDTGFEDAKDNAESEHIGPALDEAETLDKGECFRELATEDIGKDLIIHHSRQTPQQCDHRKEYPRAYLSTQECRKGLEYHIECVEDKDDG